MDASIVIIYLCHTAEIVLSKQEAESEEGEDSSEEELGSEASDEENVRPKNGKGEIRSGGRILSSP